MTDINEVRERLEAVATEYAGPLNCPRLADDLRALLAGHARLRDVLLMCRQMVVDYKHSYDGVLYAETMAECNEILEAIDAAKAVQP